MLESIDTPVIAVISDGREAKMYGPFKDGPTAIAWRKRQPLGVRCTFSALRNPDVERTYDDFYIPNRLEDEARVAREFNLYHEDEPTGAAHAG
jgi:hypothetical protein